MEARMVLTSSYGAEYSVMLVASTSILIFSSMVRPTPMQPTDTASAAHGLEGVVVADTEMSEIDGDAGRLVIRGHDVEALARAADFEGVCGLLWNGELPSADAAAAFRAELGAARVRAHEWLAGQGRAWLAMESMDALRAGAAQLASGPG